MSKQDRQGARTPADLERKYEIGESLSKLESETKKQSEQIDRQNRAMDEFIANSSDTIASMEKDISRAKKDISSLKVCLTSLSIRIGDTEGLNEVESIKKDFTTLNESIHKAEEEITRLKQKQDELSANINNRKFAVNLLDNSDFTNPVNQRGQTSYSGSTYNIDRWRTFLNDNIVTVDNGCIRQTGTQLLQNLDANVIDKTKTYTLAACKVDGTIRIISGTFANQFSNAYLSCYIVASTEIPRCVLTESDGYKWAALYEGEYTAETLPEYQPKGYGAELAECMRYYQNYPNDVFWFTVCPDNVTRFTFLFHTPMRIAPTLKYTFTAGNGSQHHVLQRTTQNGFCMDAELAGTWGHLTNLEAIADL